MAEGAVGIEDYVRLERFLKLEADMLDRRAYPAWLDLLAPEIIYRVSTRQIRDAAAGPREIVIIDETRAGLTSRLDQIGTPRLTHAENPPSLTRRFVTLVDAIHAATPDAFVVRSNILAHRVRPEDETGRLFAGTRRDVIRRLDGDFRLSERHVVLDHGLIHGGPITLLF